MGDFLLEKKVQGASSGIIVGNLSQGDRGFLDGYRSVLWVKEESPADDMTKVAHVIILDVTGKSSAQVEQAFDDFIMKSPRAMPSLYVTRDFERSSPRLKEALETLVACLESNHRTRVTRQQDGFAWQSHLFKNIPDYLLFRLPDGWEGALQGVPAFICGAGPSLDASGKALARYASQAVIFAADSSLKALAKLGVQADFAVSVDVAKFPSKCLEGATPPLRVVLSALSPPEWAQAIPPLRRFYVSGNQLTLDWLAGMGVSKTPVEVCENCGATAIALARFMGCSPICIFGMDLSLGEKGVLQRHHGEVASEVYDKSGFNAQQQFPRVPGNFSPTVPTHVIGDWRALDSRLLEWPTGLAWVVTDRGARLRNTSVFRPEQFSLLASKTEKGRALRGLVESVFPGTEKAPAIIGKLELFGQTLLKLVPELRGLLENRKIGALVERLRLFLLSGDNGQILGAYSLKLMPHLLPPPAEEKSFWRNTIDELEALGKLADQSGKSCAAALLPNA